MARVQLCFAVKEDWSRTGVGTVSYRPLVAAAVFVAVPVGVSIRCWHKVLAQGVGIRCWHS